MTTKQERELLATRVMGWNTICVDDVWWYYTSGGSPIMRMDKWTPHSDTRQAIILCERMYNIDCLNIVAERLRQSATEHKFDILKELCRAISSAMSDAF